jgi:hypothetical protein
MENTVNHIEPLFEKLEVYGKESFELYKLKTIRKAASVVSVITSNGLILIVFSMALIFSSIGISLWLGHLLGKAYLGFLCLAAFYLVLGFVFISLLNNFIRPLISNAFINQVFSK